MDFSTPRFCACHTCGSLLQFNSLLTGLVCPGCGERNYPPLEQNASTAMRQPLINLPTCPSCSCQSFLCGEGGAVLCEACGTKQTFRLRGAPVERKFNCSACQWELPIRGKQRIITCPACGMNNVMPDEAQDPFADFDFNL